MCACHKRAATCSYASLRDGLSETADHRERLSIAGASLATLAAYVSLRAYPATAGSPISLSPPA